jgi:hypothetical protein
MNHLSHEELILSYYREEPTPERQAHLADCRTCADSLSSLSSVLDAVRPVEVPEPAEDYESRVWDRLQWRLRGERKTRPSTWISWLAAAAIAAVAFVSGLLITRRADSPSSAATASAPAIEAPAAERNRILESVVARHITQSERVLVELTNAGEGDAVDAERARNLLASNRLYRRTAVENGEERLATLLDELEPVLLQIAHTPEQPDPEELQAIRKRVQSRDLVFKLRVVRDALRQPAPPSATPDHSTGI